MERIEYCTVHARKKNRYYVKIVKNAKCEGCKACGFGRKNHLILPALSQIECETGDSVAVAMPEKQVKGSYLYLYILPLLFLFAGLVIPFSYGEKAMFLGGVIGLAISIPTVYFIERLYRRSKKYLPVIVSKISATETEKPKEGEDK
ncbi:SoxR reducing system RseC family protein [Pumilibacter muris]|uniref:SoxR reducing system RseC family protein n=1 Tax=Pumilibacter muris TaxID=2941510 RepID=UPI00203FCDE9|nr:SoxR reducing system RseC family protein [Pumilibacter muris]